MENSLRADVRYVSFGQPSNAQSYLAAARRLSSGVDALANDTPETNLACVFLAAQALECALKAYLAGIGFTINRLTHAPLGHDLEKLWIEAATRGLNVPARPPQWCAFLNEEHGVEFPFHDPANLRGMQGLELLAMARDLEVLLNVVAKTV